MRSNPNLRGSNGGCAGGKLGHARIPVAWLEAGSWRLPSGKALAEFALQAGFLAPLLFKTDGQRSRPDGGPMERSLKHSAFAGKQVEKGSGQ